ncbi:MAG TPA: InlB B-repeat-containing protein, partial [bacterium]|nr:InlB B-repeat-containing protein [bacterium]
MKKLIFMAMILISFISCSTSVDTGKAPAEEKVIMQTRSVVASDQGSNYSGGWTDGSNGGSGFGPWIIMINAGTGSAGNFIGDPFAAEITGMSSTSFGLYANPAGSGAVVDASRAFNAPLSTGDTFSFQWGVNWDSNGTGEKGFVMMSGASTLVTIKMAGSGTITINGADMFVNYGVNAMTINCAVLSSTQLRVYATGRDGTETYDNTFTFGETIAPDSIAFYAQFLDTGDQRQPYFDQLKITAIDVSPVPFETKFGVEANWNLISAAESYGEKEYEEENWNFYALNAARATGVETFDGSNYAFRDRSDFLIKNKGSVTALGGFAFQFGDMMDVSEPEIPRNLDVSFNGGANWTRILDMGKSWFEGETGYKELVYIFPTGNDDFSADEFQVIIRGNANDTNLIKIGQFKVFSTYTLSFDAQDGFGVFAHKYVANGYVVGELPTPGRTGYKFDGWFTEEDGAGSFVDADYVYALEADSTIYAKWTDVNECDTANGGCAQNCINSIGSHTCSCDAGYSLNIDG